MLAIPGQFRALAAFLLLVVAATAPRAQDVTGQHYAEIVPPRPVATGERIEVLEFFYYGCPVCYEAQPHIARWLAKAGNDVSLRRVPAVTVDGWEAFARSYYALEALGLLERLHWAVYDSHHFDGKRLDEEAPMIDWVAAHGGDGSRFAGLRNSREIKARVDQARQMLELYGVRGVPSLVIDGKYLASARLAGGVREMMMVVDQLVARAREERRKN